MSLCRNDHRNINVDITWQQTRVKCYDLMAKHTENLTIIHETFTAFIL